MRLSSSLFAILTVALFGSGCTIRARGVASGGAECPAGSYWNGNACIWNSVVCPQGSHYNGRSCVAGNQSQCPAGTYLRNGRCEGGTTGVTPTAPQPGNGGVSVNPNPGGGVTFQPGGGGATVQPGGGVTVQPGGGNGVVPAPRPGLPQFRPATPGRRPTFQRRPTGGGVGGAMTPAPPGPTLQKRTELQLRADGGHCYFTLNNNADRHVRSEWRVPVQFGTYTVRCTAVDGPSQGQVFVRVVNVSEQRAYPIVFPVGTPPRTRRPSVPPLRRR